jgi:orotidine-5'-phosphate decarboxylase
VRFADKLERAWSVSGAMLCVGLDPAPERFPPEFARRPRPVLSFNQWIIDTVGDLVCAFKPQAAHHGAAAAECDLAQTIAYIRSACPHALIILDAKRGDVDSTARMYAREAFDRFDADAVTVNPFLGEETLIPFLEREDRGALVLCRTSNRGADWIQGLDAGGEPLFAAIARRAQSAWNALDNVMLVVGATAPEDIAVARAAAPDLAFLAPGVGTQGGSARAVVEAGARTDGRGLVVSASRSVIEAGDRQAVRDAAEDLRRALLIAPGQLAARPDAPGPGVRGEPEAWNAAHAPV